MTTNAALQSQHGVELGYVLAIEGYDHLIVSHDPSGALAAWSATDWSQAISGLIVQGEVSQGYEPWSVAIQANSINFTVAGEGGETLARALFRRGRGIETSLRNSIGEADTAIPVGTVAAFPSSGVIWIGNERIEYTSRLTGVSSFLGCTRGTFAPFKADTEASDHRFGQPHSVVTNELGVRIKPTVSDERRIWEGARVGLWIHEIVGGVWNSKAEARLEFAGRIVGIEDAPDGSVSITADDVRADLTKATLLGDQYVARLPDQIYILANDFIVVGEYFDGGSANAQGLAFVPSPDPGNPNQAQSGKQSLDELASAINRWLSHEQGEGNLAGRWSFGFTAAKHSQFSVALAGVATSGRENYGFYVRCPDRIGHGILGYTQAQPEAIPPTVRFDFRLGETTTTSTERALGISDEPAQRLLVLPTSVTQQLLITVEGLRGTWVNNHDFAPEPLRSLFHGVSDWGFVDILGHVTPVERVDAETFRVLRGNSDEFWLKDSVKASDLSLRYDNLDPIEARQVFIIQDSLSGVLSKLLYSTNGESYNHASLDVLPSHIGVGIPGELLSDFVGSAEAIEGTLSSQAVTLVLEKPTSFVAAMGADLLLRAAFFVFESGGLRLSTLKTTIPALATHTLTESNKAAPSGQGGSQIGHVRFDISNLVNRVTVKFNRDIAGEYRDRIVILNPASISDHGDAGTLEIEARNIYSGVQGGTDIMLAIAEDLAKSLIAIFGRPVPILKRTINHQLYHLVPGDSVSVTDDGARNPDTGERGIEAMPGIALTSRHSWGGDGSVNTGETELLLIERSRIALISPAMRIDSTHSVGNFDAGYDPVSLTFRVRSNEYSSATGGGRDSDEFNAGDKVRVIELDPSDPEEATHWDRTIDSISGDDIVITAGISSPAWDNTKQYRIVSQPYAEATASQRADVYFADDADFLIQDTVKPYEFSLPNSGKQLTYPTALDSLPERMPAFGADDGSPRNPSVDHAIGRAANNRIDYKSAPQLPSLVELTSGITNVQGDGLLVKVIPFFVGRGSGISRPGQYRPIVVAPILEAVAGQTMELRITAAHLLPHDGADTPNLDVQMPAGVHSVEFSETATTPTRQAEQKLRPSFNPQLGICYLIVEMLGTATGIYYGTSAYLGAWEPLP